jgi:hypothetical protein
MHKGCPLTEHTKKTPAEEITNLLEELYERVTTREKIPHYRQVRRATTRTVAVLDWREHTTHEPGLLTQLGIIQSTGHHPGTVIPGAALPSGSPGWDDDGALAPLVGGSPDPGEPIGDAWHTAAQINADLTNFERELHETGHQGSLIDIALNDEHTGKRIAARLRGFVSRARIAADYDAPIVPLRDVYCPECGGQLRVRKDASSGVWCAGVRDAEGHRIGGRYLEGPALEGEQWPAPVCDATWPRGAWVKLLRDAEAEMEAS